MLKDMDRFSGAAGSAARKRRGRPAGLAAGLAGASGRGGGACGGGSGRGERAAAPSPKDDGVSDDDDDDDMPASFQPRPAGPKAVKWQRAAELAAAREAGATRAALNRMARVAENRVGIAIWGASDVRGTEEAAQWRRLKMRRRLKALAAATREDEDSNALEA